MTAHLVPGLGVGAPGEELGDHVGVACPAGVEEGCVLVLTGSRAGAAVLQSIPKSSLNIYFSYILANLFFLEL